MSEESLLALRVRSRHEKALSDFIGSIREIHSDFDQQSVILLNSLKSRLSDNLLQRADLIENHRNALNTFKQQVEETASVFMTDPECPLLDDDLHTDGEDSLLLRKERLEAKKRETLLVAQDCFRLHGESMQAIDNAEAELLRNEVLRVESTRALLDKLGSAVAAAAHVNETELQVIVQKATHSVNKVLLQNQVGIKKTISSCRQSELLSTRESLAHAADLYNDQLKVMQDSIILWTVQYLGGPVFTQPGHRQELLRSLLRHSSKIKEEVRQSLRGLTVLAETLCTARENSVAIETFGGTDSNGWLRFYDEDFHHPLFSRPPQTISTEWETFLSVIVKNAKCSSLELLEAFSAAEKSLVEESERVKRITLEQLSELYTPTPEEHHIISSSCLSEEFRFPLNTICSRAEDSAKAHSELEVIVDPMLLDIKSRGDTFVRLVAEVSSARTDELAGCLLQNCNSILSYVSATTSELERAATKSVGKLRAFWLTQEESTKDFDDLTHRLEVSYETITTSLRRAGAIHDADILFAKGMDLLNKLEEAYHHYHHECIGPMDSFEVELSSSLSEDKQKILSVLRISESGDGRDVKGPAGRRYVITDTEWRFESQILVVPAELPVPPPEIIAPPKKGKPQPKRGKDVVSTPTPSPPPAAVQIPVVDAVAESFRKTILEVLTPESLIEKRFTSDFLSSLQISFAQWILMLEERSLKSFSTFCKKRRDALNSQVNELIRRHQRRAPSLQSGIYELRVRELQSSQQNRQRQLESFEHRMGVMVKMIDACLEDSHDIVSENVAQLGSLTNDVREITTRQVLETHGRTFDDTVRKMKETVLARKQTIERQIVAMVESISSDCENFKTNGMKTFDQGGAITEVERRESLKLVGEFMERLSIAEEDAKTKLSECIREEIAMLNNTVKHHGVATEQCLKELTFFASVNNVLSELKGKVYNTILANENLNAQLEDLISAFELAVRDRVQGEKDHISFNSCLLQGKAASASKYENVRGMDEDLSSRLRQTQADASMLFQNSRSQRILESMLNLRLPLFNRGAVLDALKYSVEFYRVSSDLLVDPTEDVIDILLAAPRPAQPAPLKKAKPLNTKEAKVVPSVIPTTPAIPSNSTLSVSADGFIETSKEIVTPPTTLCADMSGLCANAQQTIDRLIDEYVSVAGNVILRPQVLGGTTPAELHASTAERIRLHFKKIEEYSDEGRRKYRGQTQRVLIAMSDAAEEIFRCLQSVCSRSLALRLEDVVASFYTCYNCLVHEREVHNQRLKGCLSAPSNRPALVNLVEEEEEREVAAQKAIKTMWAVSLREIQSESRRMAMRCLVSLQSFFWLSRGLVSPDHLVPGGAAALGEHKGLRRLLRKGERTNQSVPEAAVIGAVEKPVVSSPLPAKTEKGKKAAPKEPEIQQKFELQPLELPTRDFDGVDPNKLQMFDQFVAQSTETSKALVNHYLLPSQWHLRPSAEPAPVVDVGKKDIKGKKPAVVAAPIQEPVEVCAHHKAPASQIFLQAFYSRERTIDVLRNVMQHAANDATKHFAGLLLVERQWAHSWNDAIARL